MDKNIGLACNITTGKLDANKAVNGGKYPFFTCAEFPDTIDSYAFDDDVVLVAGNNAKGNFHVSRYKGKFNAYQRTYVLSAKNGFNIDYIYYALKLELKRLRERSQGSQTKFITMPILTSIHLRDLSYDKQSSMAQVLSTLDAKIECNAQINAELEGMAKTLYDYWFVQFDFPDQNGEPYKSSGGKMVYSLALKREIPVGWDVVGLSEIANITMGQSPPGESYNQNDNGIIFYQGCTDFGTRFPTPRKYTTSPTRFAKKNDILLSVRAPVGSFNIANEDCCIGRGLAALNSKDNCISYLLGVISNLKQVFERRNNDGTTFGAITKNDLFSLPVINPPSIILNNFNELAHPIFEKQNINALENAKLSQLRDWLLPMLMNGQVIVQ